MSAALLRGVLLLFALPLQASEPLLIATAANFKPAMEALVAQFKDRHPDARVEPVYGSTGKLSAQIREGAPFDLFFSADMNTPEQLAAAGFASSPVRVYARGRLVIWSTASDATRLALVDLVRPQFNKIAIANPRHAPYGQRAEEALRAAGVWDAIESRLVYGENIAQAAQFVHSGNAQAGIIALPQALAPELARRGGYALIDEALHAPLDQGLIVTRRAAERALATAFADFTFSDEARRIIERHGYVVAAHALAPAE